MGRRNATALTAAALMLATSGCGLFGDSVEGSLEPLGQAVHESARTSATFRVAAATDFDWDRVHLFQPYATEDVINRDLGFEWSDAGDSSNGASDSVQLVVFVGYFPCVTYPVIKGGLNRREAVLRVVRTREGGSLRYVSLARPRNAGEAARVERCARTYYD